MVSCNGTLFFRARYMQATGEELYGLDLPTAIDEREAKQALLHPNPASNHLSLAAFPPNAMIRLFAMDGRLALTASRQVQVDVSALPTGVYAALVDDQSGRILDRQLVVIER